jgi:hypothetical protein
MQKKDLRSIDLALFQALDRLPFPQILSRLGADAEERDFCGKPSKGIQQIL